MTDPAQIAIWEALPPVPGKRSQRIWGCPARVWDAARKLAERSGSPRNPAAVAAMVPREVQRLRLTPHWRSRPTPAIPEVLRLVEVETVVIPADRTSSSMRRMVLEGRMPGMRWDPERGVVKVSRQARFQESK